MRPALTFTSGCLMTAAIYAYILPDCGIAAWLAGFFCMGLALLVTLFIEGALSEVQP